MSYAVVLRFEGVNEDQYWSVCEELGIDRGFTQNLPEALVIHVAGPVGDDGWLVSEVWATRDAQEAFLADRLGPALATLGVPGPAQVIDSDPVNCQVVD
jgi:hypothetical protein